MKKIMFSLLSATALLCSTSCSDDAIVSEAGGEEAAVQFNVQLSDGSSASRAISDGELATDLFYEVYATKTVNGKVVLDETPQPLRDLDVLKKNAFAENGQCNINLALVKGQTYYVVFWAQYPDAYVKSVSENLTEINVTPYLANDKRRDAFTAVKEITVTGANSYYIELTRPFAQVNFGTLRTDMEAAEAAGAVLRESSITVTNAAQSFNALKQEGERLLETATFGLAKILDRDTEELEIAENQPSYEYLATAYVMYPGKASDKGTSDLTLTVPTQLNCDVVIKVPFAPVQRNYRTNVLGNLLTNQTDFTVVVDASFDGDEIKEVWDGKSVEAPVYNEETETYTVETPENLAWLAAAVNGTLPAEARANMPADNFAGKTFVLEDNVNLANQAWTPIGTSSNPFKGTFDGKGKTIYNLNVEMPGKSNAGLFGVTHDGEIKNFTVENAKVTGRLNVGVVAGQPYTSKYTDITVQGHVEVNGMAYVGAVGGKNAYADWTNITVNADETSYVKAHSVENGTAYRTYVGGVVGFNGEGGHKFSNITSNIDVKGSTCDVGGLFGIAHYGNNFEKCSCTGNVEIYAAEEAEDAQEIGGIAGVWHNETGYTVTFTECLFKGTLATNIEGVEFYNGGLVGKPYSATGTGTLVIDGVSYKYMSNGVYETVDGYAIYNAEGLKWVADVVNATTPYTPTLFDGKTVKLLNNINLQNNEWIPIGDDRSQRTEWHGVFDGQGYTVKNIKITKKTDREDDNKSSYGLFGNVKGTVKNVIVENVSIAGAPKFIGALVGRLNDGLVENCHVKNATVTCNNWTIGGVVGQWNNGKISGCTIENSTIEGYAAVGGIVGIALNSGERVIENCSVISCEIKKNGSFGGNYDKMFGGIVGSLYSGKLVVDIVNCCVVEGTKIEGVESSVLCGYVADGDILKVNGAQVYPSLVKDGKTYVVYSAAGLVELAGMKINGGETVKLAANIDLAGVEFNGLSAFNPEPNNTFDGQGYTVSNWTNNSKASDMGFIKSWVGTIKNVNFENCHLKTSGRSAIVAGNTYANIENVTVNNCSIEDSYWACGLVAGLYNSGSVSNCTVTNSSVKSNGGTAAVVGVVNEDGGTRSFTNCKVEGCTINNTGVYGEAYSGAVIAGMLNISNATVKFVGCSKSNNTLQGNHIHDAFTPADDSVTIVIE